MRAYLADMQEQPSPFKAYYLARMYRYGAPAGGPATASIRQFGIEVFGAEEPGADVEVIAVGDTLPAGARARPVSAPAELDRRRGLPARIPRGAHRLPRADRRRSTDEHRDRFEDNPLRVLDCKDDACRAVALEAPKITDHLCDAVSRALRRRAGWAGGRGASHAVLEPTAGARAWTTTRGRRSSS